MKCLSRRRYDGNRAGSNTVWMRLFAIIFFFRRKIPVPWFWQVSETRVEFLKFKKRSKSRSLVSSSFFRALSCHLKLLRDITSYVILCRYRSTAFGPHIAIDCSLIINSRRVSCRDFSCHLIEAKELLLQLLSV